MFDLLRFYFMCWDNYWKWFTRFWLFFMMQKNKSKSTAIYRMSYLYYVTCERNTLLLFCEYMKVLFEIISFHIQWCSFPHYFLSFQKLIVSIQKIRGTGANLWNQTWKWKWAVPWPTLAMAVQRSNSKQWVTNHNICNILKSWSQKYSTFLRDKICTVQSKSMSPWSLPATEVKNLS